MARNGDEIPPDTDDTFRPLAVSRLPVDSAQVHDQPERRNGRSRRLGNDSDPGRLLHVNDSGIGR